MGNYTSREQIEKNMGDMKIAINSIDKKCDELNVRIDGLIARLDGIQYKVPYNSLDDVSMASNNSSFIEY